MLKIDYILLLLFRPTPPFLPDILILSIKRGKKISIRGL